MVTMMKIKTGISRLAAVLLAALVLGATLAPVGLAATADHHGAQTAVHREDKCKRIKNKRKRKRCEDRRRHKHEHGQKHH
jgi:hypothetical protein